MERNKKIDIVRAFAILIIVFYHVYAITSIKTGIDVIDIFLINGGIIGISLFFILSGYGIYYSLKKSYENNTKFKYTSYIKKRLSRIGPQYYFSLSVLLLLTGNAVYLAKEHLLSLVSHAFLFHNLFWKIAGSISGVCWTLGVTFQFYLIAPILYKVVNKYPKVSLVCSNIIAIISKYLIFHFLIAPTGITNTFIYSTYGNQVLTALQFFVSGMFLAHISMKIKKNNINLIGVIISTIFIFLVLKLSTINSTIISNTGIYSDCIMAYIWHNILCLALILFMYFFMKLKFNDNAILSKGLLFISKYEYGIYLWHLVIINALTENSMFIKNLIVWHPLITYIPLTILSIIVGVISTEIVENYNWKELYNKYKKEILILLGGLVLIVVLYFIKYIISFI